MVALDRADAVRQALFDASPQATLARKYEAATERSLFRTLKELREREDRAAQRAEPTEPEAEPDAKLDEPGDSDTLGSFLPEPDPAQVEPSPEVDLALARAEHRAERPSIPPKQGRRGAG